MTQTRETKKKPAPQLEPNKAEEVFSNESRGRHYLLQLQRSAGNRAVVGLLESHRWVQTKLRSESAGDELEHGADVAAKQVMQLAFVPAGVLQRKCATCTPTSKCAECEDEEARLQRKPKDSVNRVVQLKPARSSATPVVQRAPRNGDSTGTATTAPGTATENAPEPATSTAGPLIVGDDAPTVAPGQIRKSEFLEQLRSTVCRTADEALAQAGQSTEGCPYIEQWLSYYEDQEPAHIERALRKYAPEAAMAKSAGDYIPAVSDRVRRAVATWAKTGEITGVPPELAGMLSGSGAGLGAVAGMIGGALSGIGSAIGGAVSAVAGAVGSAFSSIGKAFFKRKEGQGEGNTGVTNPAEIQHRLSGGQSLDSAAKSRMSEAFGHDFSGVRVHTNAEAAGLSDSLNARAFTIGSDIAFGAGEYQPGTLIGDALIAHELAHVVQQGGGNGSSPPQSKSPGGYETLEDDADMSAVGAVVSAWGGVPGALKDIGRNAMPRLKSGLRLQSCGPKPDPQTPYEELIVEGTEKLQEPRTGFGFPWILMGDECDSKENAEKQRFDLTHWKSEKAGKNECMLVNVGSASAAIDALFDEKNRSKWDVDCRIFSELPHWYAMRHTLPDFDKRFPRIELRRKNLTGLQTRAYWFEDSPMSGLLVEAELNKDTKQGAVEKEVGAFMEPVRKAGAQARPEKEVVDSVPVGSRVTFGTYPAAEGYQASKDNTVKMGNDLYAAHEVPVGVDAMYTREEMVKALRQKYDPYGSFPERRFRIIMIDVFDVEAMTRK